MNPITEAFTPTLERVDELLISQYSQADNLRNMIKAYVSPIESITQTMAQSIDSRSIDLAVGYSLDKIAKVVGESRIVIGARALPYFGFHENPTALGLDIGIFFSDGGKTTDDLILSDMQLRNLIRARIIKNTSGGRLEDVLTYCDLLVGRKLDIELKEGVASVDVTIHEDLEVQDKLLLAIRVTQIISPGITITMRDNNGLIEILYDN